VVPEINFDLTILAPVTPAKADFNESIESQSDILSVLVPVKPVEADYE